MPARHLESHSNPAARAAPAPSRTRRRSRHDADVATGRRHPHATATSPRCAPADPGSVRGSSRDRRPEPTAGRNHAATPAAPAAAAHATSRRPRPTSATTSSGNAKTIAVGRMPPDQSGDCSGEHQGAEPTIASRLPHQQRDDRSATGVRRIDLRDQCVKQHDRATEEECRRPTRRAAPIGAARQGVQRAARRQREAERHEMQTAPRVPGERRRRPRQPHVEHVAGGLRVMQPHVVLSERQRELHRVVVDELWCGRQEGHDRKDREPDQEEWVHA